MHPVRGTPVKSLISASKDGLLKVWDLQSQSCIGTFGEQTLSKVVDFAIIGSLGLLVVASTDRALRIFRIDINQEDSDSQIGSLKLLSTAQFTKESS